MEIRRKKQVVGALAVIGACCGFGPAIAWAAPQTPPSAPVTVLNTPTNPVPVTVQGGNVTGTVSATQSGNWNVGVINSSSNPVVVTDVTKREIFAVRGFGPNLLNQVPAGKIYVIDHWNVRCTTPLNASMINANLRSNGPGNDVEIADFAVPHFLGPNGPSGLLYAASSNPTIRLRAGATFSIDVDTDPHASALDSCVSSITGYMMDAI